jgi:aryl-alcohol dehydrogenase-like predicted oxidoreductase
MGKGVNDAGLSRHQIIAQAEASLKRLDTDYIDVYYLHQPDYDTPLEESLEAVSNLVKAGKVRYVGLSNYASWQVADALAICDKRNYVSPVVTENIYNLITRGIENELVPCINEHKLGLTIYNPIAAGILTGKHKAGTPAEGTRFGFSDFYRKRYWNDDNFKIVDLIKKIADDAGVEMLELALKWCAQQPHVTSIISGVSRLEQLQQNVKILENSSVLSPEVMKQCDDLWTIISGNRTKYNR